MINNLLCNRKVPWMLKVPYGTINSNKEPLFLRANHIDFVLSFTEHYREFCVKVIDLLCHRSRDLQINPTIRKREASHSAVFWICDMESSETQ